MRRGVVLALVVAIATAFSATSAAAAAKQVPRPTEFRVGVTTLQFDNAGRELTATVYYPASGRTSPVQVVDAAPNTRWGPYPLILFSHEFGATPSAYAALIDAWTRSGYVVAVPTYPPNRVDESTTDGSASNQTDGQQTIDVGQRVFDASFLIDRLLDRVPGGVNEVIDGKKVIAAGHALGAVTTFVLAYSTELRDPRIDAAVTLAGGVAGDTSNYFSGIDTPLLQIHGDADTINPITATKDAFKLASPPKFFVTLLGGDHATSYVSRSDPGFGVVSKTTLDFFSAYVNGRISGLQQLARDGKVKSVATIVGDPA
jgi:dienelactone hydrolase